MIFNKVKLKELIICYDKKRKPLSTMQRANIKGKYPYYGAQEIIDYINDYIFDGKYLLFAEDGENLRSKLKPLVNKVEGKFWLNNHAHIFTNNEKIDFDYLYYALLNTDIAHLITGSTQPKLNQENLMKIELNIPSLNEQKKIGNILRAIDNKIEINYRINNNLNELVNSIYLEYVSSLDENNSSRIEIKNIAKCILGGTPSRVKSEYWNGSINWINSGEINKFRIIEASEYITDLGLSKSSTTLLPRETTVLAITGATLGQVSRLEIESCANQSVIGIVPNDVRCNNYIYLTMLNNIGDLALRQTGGAQQHINKNDVETFEVIVPNNIEEFDNKVSKIFEKISINCFQNKTLEQLRDALLPKLMNGEIDLDNIEI